MFEQFCSVLRPYLGTRPPARRLTENINVLEPAAELRNYLGTRPPAGAQPKISTFAGGGGNIPEHRFRLAVA